MFTEHLVSVTSDRPSMAQATIWNSIRSETADDSYRARHFNHSSYVLMKLRQCTGISNMFNFAGHLNRSEILTPLCHRYGTMVLYNGLRRIGWHYVQNLVTYLYSVYNHWNVCIPIANFSWDSMDRPVSMSVWLPQKNIKRHDSESYKKTK